MYLKTFCIAILMMPLFRVYARWADKEDATYKVNFAKITYNVRKDGSSLTTYEREIEILKDQARDVQGMHRQNFDSSISTLRVIGAQTINGKQRIAVSEHNIEIKPLASSGPGFDVIHQLTIAYPDVRVGSRLYFKIEIDETRAIIPGMFFAGLVPWGEWIEQYEVKAKSEIPLFVSTHDPDQLLVQKVKPQEVEIKLKRPYFRNVVDEDYQYLDASKYIWLAISSLKDWTAFPPATLKAYEDELNAKLPAKFQKILEQARTGKTDVDQINRVTSLLAENVRYVGDWRALEGLWHPRGLGLIAQTGYGDCKDFSIVTASLLRHLGFEARIAWLARGRDFVASPLNQKNLDVNLAIVHARKDGVDYWIDPTNMVSFSQGVFPDIAGRTALVLYPDRIEVQRTPDLKEDQGELRIREVHTFPEPSRIRVTGHAQFKGRAALPWTALQLSSSRQNIEAMLIGLFVPPANVESWKFGAIDLRSRIVKDFSTDFSYVQDWHSIWTTAGQGYALPSNYAANLFRIRTQDRVSHVVMTDPLMLRREIVVKNPKVQLERSKECFGQSKWSDYSRRLEKVGEQLIVHEAISIKKPHLPVQEVTSQEYHDFKEKLLRCLQDLIVVID